MHGPQGRVVQGEKEVRFAALSSEINLYGSIEAIAVFEAN